LNIENAKLKQFLEIFNHKFFIFLITRILHIVQVNSQKYRKKLKFSYFHNFCSHILVNLSTDDHHFGLLYHKIDKKNIVCGSASTLIPNVFFNKKIGDVAQVVIVHNVYLAKFGYIQKYESRKQ
jgi:hypothetical protein